MLCSTTIISLASRTLDVSVALYINLKRFVRFAIDMDLSGVVLCCWCVCVCAANEIIQPVIQYGKDEEGGGDFWRLASWSLYLYLFDVHPCVFACAPVCIHVSVLCVVLCVLAVVLCRYVTSSGHYVIGDKIDNLKPGTIIDSLMYFDFAKRSWNIRGVLLCVCVCCVVFLCLCCVLTL